MSETETPADTTSLSPLGQALHILKELFHATDNRLRVPEVKVEPDPVLKWNNGNHSLLVTFSEPNDAHWCYENTECNGYLGGTFALVPPSEDQKYPSIFLHLLPLFHVP